MSILKAILDIQAELKPIKKGAYNPHHKSRYADFEDIMGDVGPLLAKHGVVYTCKFTETHILGRLIHIASGETEESIFPTTYDANPQKMGSTATYARRYMLSAMLNVVCTGEDDDGNGGQDQRQGQQRQQQRPPQGQQQGQQRQQGGPEAPIPTSDALVKRMWASVKQLGFSDIGAKEEFAKVLGRQFETTKSFTRSDVKKIVDHLSAMIAAENNANGG